MSTEKLQVAGVDMDVSEATVNSLKRRKEEFVSNLNGSAMLEIAALSAIVPAFVILRQLFGLLWEAPEEASVVQTAEQSSQRDKLKHKKKYLVNLLTDFLIICVPTLACVTVLADSVYIITAISICLILAGIASYSRLEGKVAVAASPRPSSPDKSDRKTFLSSFRFTMMLVTCVSILAVDFNIFPRRYAKTEIYGTGLMDLGVGSFVVANGLVSKQARNLPPSKHGGVLRNTSPLLVLGFARLIVTKGVDYQEHVAEYGVHWNFFFTLAAVALLTSLIHVPASFCGILGLIMLGGYQTILSSGLNIYLFSPERGPSLISLNKEGVFSILGYWSMYLISVQLGQYLLGLPKTVFSRKKDDKESGRRAKWWTAIDVWLLVAIFWLMTIFVDEFIERVSRRTCNLGYVIFIFASNLEIIAILFTADLLLPHKQITLLRVFDSNLLATFLLGNVLTGLVNMTVDTLSASYFKAMTILLGYLVTLVGVMSSVDFFNLRMKFW